MLGTRVKSRDLRVAVVIPTHWDHLMGGSQYQAKLIIEQLYATYGATQRMLRPFATSLPESVGFWGRKLVRDFFLDKPADRGGLNE